MAVILLSGGLDSAVNLALVAKEKSENHLAITIDYLQKAREREIFFAKELADFYGVDWQVISLPWLGEKSGSALNRSEVNLPKFEINELDDKEKTKQSMSQVWVPNRNGIFIQIAAMLAESKGMKEVYVGFNKEEASTFPDNSAEFLDACNRALSYSTLNRVELKSLTIDMNKSEIVRKGLESHLPFEKVWSCYTGEQERCWQCESCMRTVRALLSQQDLGKATLAKMGWTK
ncbi:MAG: 7-cyano-7-deazaguanine synthase QueC [Oligoflexia bacterium]|nr:7-cyano-7-deazaguanine synthase QueC [Oligoflexia bacterium]